MNTETIIDQLKVESYDLLKVLEQLREDYEKVQQKIKENTKQIAELYKEVRK